MPASFFRAISSAGYAARYHSMCMPDTAPASRPLFLTGASGFVGAAVLDELLSRGYRVNALLRGRAIEREGVTSFQGDLFDDGVLDVALRDCTAAIHLVGIIRERPDKGQTFERIHYEGAKHVIDAARRNGVRRFVHMSAIGVQEDSPSEYASTKARAEAHLRQAGLDFTILRPSIIHGPKGEFLHMMADWAYGRAMPYFFMPYFGRGVFGFGKSKIQPIYVNDVARAFVDCIDKCDLIGQTIDLAGPQQLTWPQMYGVAADVLTGKRKLTVAIPIWYARLLTQLAPASFLPFNRAQVEMAGEDNTSSIDVIERHFGWQPLTFREALRSYKEQIGS